MKANSDVKKIMFQNEGTFTAYPRCLGKRDKGRNTFLINNLKQKMVSHS